MDLFYWCPKGKCRVLNSNCPMQSFFFFFLGPWNLSPPMSLSYNKSVSRSLNHNMPLWLSRWGMSTITLKLFTWTLESHSLECTITLSFFSILTSSAKCNYMAQHNLILKSHILSQSCLWLSFFFEDGGSLGNENCLKLNILCYLFPTDGLNWWARRGKLTKTGVRCS